MSAGSGCGRSGRGFLLFLGRRWSVGSSMRSSIVCSCSSSFRSSASARCSTGANRAQAQFQSMIVDLAQSFGGGRCASGLEASCSAIRTARSSCSDGRLRRRGVFASGCGDQGAKGSGVGCTFGTRRSSIACGRVRSCASVDLPVSMAAFASASASVLASRRMWSRMRVWPARCRSAIIWSTMSRRG